MTEAAESLNRPSQGAIEAWALPDRLPGNPNVTLRSTIEGRSKGLSEDEITRVHMGVVELASVFTGGNSNTNLALGFDFRRGEEQDTFLVRHQGWAGQTKIEAKVRRQPGSGYTPILELFDASRVEDPEH